MTVIGITGAAGELGRSTTMHVLRSHRTSDTVLLSRSPEALYRLRNAGVTVRHADFDEPAGLSRAFSGIDVLLLISTDTVGSRRTRHLAAINAAEAAGVGRIVYTSLPNADGEFPARLRPVSDDHAATEAALRTAGPAWSILRNALYMEGYADTWRRARSSGRLVTNHGTGRHAPVARDDCARAAAAVLLGHGHDNAVYDITGPRMVDDLVIARELTMRSAPLVEVFHIDDGQFLTALTAAHVPPELASTITGFGEAIRQNRLITPLGDTERLIGQAPTDLMDFLA